LEFSKEDKKSLVVQEGKEISFVLENDSIWRKADIFRITTDSIFLEHKPSSRLFNSCKDSSFVKGYELIDFRYIAYKKTSSVIGGTGIILGVGAVSLIAFASGTIDVDYVDIEKPFDKVIDLEKGWKLTITECTQ